MTKSASSQSGTLSACAEAKSQQAASCPDAQTTQDVNSKGSKAKAFKPKSAKAIAEEKDLLGLVEYLEQEVQDESQALEKQAKAREELAKMSSAKQQQSRRLTGLNREIPDELRLLCLRILLVNKNPEKKAIDLALKTLYGDKPTQAEIDKARRLNAKRKASNKLTKTKYNQIGPATKSREQMWAQLEDFYALHPDVVFLPRYPVGRPPSPKTIAQRQEKLAEKQFTPSNDRSVTHALKADSSNENVAELMARTQRIGGDQFAKSSKNDALFRSKQKSWKAAVNQELTNREKLELMINIVDASSTAELKATSADKLFAGVPRMEQIQQGKKGRNPKSIEAYMLDMAFCFAYDPVAFFHAFIKGKRPSAVKHLRSSEYLAFLKLSLQSPDERVEALKLEPYALANYAPKSREKLAVSDEASRTRQENFFKIVLESVVSQANQFSQLVNEPFSVSDLKAMQQLEGRMTKEELLESQKLDKSKEFFTSATNNDKCKTKSRATLSDQQKSDLFSLTAQNYQQARNGVLREYSDVDVFNGRILMVDACLREVDIEDFPEAKRAQISHSRNNPTYGKAIKTVVAFDLEKSFPVAIKFFSPDISDQSALAKIRKAIMSHYSLKIFTYDKGFIELGNKAAMYHSGEFFLEVYKSRSNKHIEERTAEAAVKFLEKDHSILISADYEREYIVERVDLRNKKLGLCNSDQGDFYVEKLSTEENKALNMLYPNCGGLVDEVNQCTYRKLEGAATGNSGKWVREYAINPDHNRMYLVHLKELDNTRNIKYLLKRFNKQLDRLNALSKRKHDFAKRNIPFSASEQNELNSLKEIIESMKVSLDVDQSGNCTVNYTQVRNFFRGYGVRTYVTNIHLEELDVSDHVDAIIFAEFIHKLYKARWNIEIYFKTTKSFIGATKTSSENKWHFTLQTCLAMTSGSLVNDFNTTVEKRLYEHYESTGKYPTNGSSEITSQYALNKTLLPKLSATYSTESKYQEVPHLTVDESKLYKLAFNAALPEPNTLNQYVHLAKQSLSSFFPTVNAKQVVQAAT